MAPERTCRSAIPLRVAWRGMVWVAWPPGKRGKDRADALAFEGGHLLRSGENVVVDGKGGAHEELQR